MKLPKARILIIGLLLLIAIVSMQSVYDFLYPPSSAPEFHYIADGKVVKMVVPHLSQMVSDIYWIKSVLYFGRQKNLLDSLQMMRQNFIDVVRSDSAGQFMRVVIPSYRTLSAILQTVTDLDPYFTYPYLFGGLFLSLGGGLVTEAVSILRKGQKYFPNDWRFPFYLGFNYFFFKNDTVAALKEFVQTAALPECPPIVNSLIEGISLKISREDLAVNFLKGAAATTNNQGIRKELEKLIKKIQEKD